MTVVIETVVADYYRALRERDGGSLTRVLAPDVICFDPVDSAPREGRIDMREWLEQADGSDPLDRCEELVIVAEDGAAVQWDLRPEGPGMPAGVRGIDLFEIGADGLISTIWSYWVM